MKKTLVVVLSALLVLSGCESSSQLHNALWGSSLGGMFGSCIGGIVGGGRGHDQGAALGMIAGAVAGAAATAATEKHERAERRAGATTPTYRGADDSDVSYRTYASDRTYAPASPWESLEITEVAFSDANDNRCLDADEHAYISIDIYNRGASDICNVAPIIKCSNSKVTLSPTAIIERIPAGEGVRYKVAVVAGKSLRDGTLTFTVSFCNEGGQKGVTAKTFTIASRR
ncbi:MAG: hypothetical protein KBS47_02780 [Bacteroidales bacterium]|nr:hypothetical protein [Candidatus Equimonas enterica]